MIVVKRMGYNYSFVCNTRIINCSKYSGSKTLLFLTFYLTAYFYFQVILWWKSWPIVYHKNGLSVGNNRKVINKYLYIKCILIITDTVNFSETCKFTTKIKTMFNLFAEFMFRLLYTTCSWILLVKTWQCLHLLVFKN